MEAERDNDMINTCMHPMIDINTTIEAASPTPFPNPSLHIHDNQIPSFPYSLHMVRCDLPSPTKHPFKKRRPRKEEMNTHISQSVRLRLIRK